MAVWLAGCLSGWLALAGSGWVLGGWFVGGWKDNGWMDGWIEEWMGECESMTPFPHYCLTVGYFFHVLRGFIFTWLLIYENTEQCQCQGLGGIGYISDLMLQHYGVNYKIFEPSHEKPCFLYMQKQRRRSAAR